jgi:hypothetical protein
VRERPKNRGSNKGGGIKEKKEELKEEEKEIKTWNIQKTTLKECKRNQSGIESEREKGEK